jgi:hypothetical protein
MPRRELGMSAMPERDSGHLLGERGAGARRRRTDEPACGQFDQDFATADAPVS